MTDRTKRICGLALLAATAACAPTAHDVSPSEGPVDTSAFAGAPAPANSTGQNPTAPGNPAPTAHHPGGAPFSPRIARQLAARGIKVDEGPEPARTTVEQKWIVQGRPMTKIAENAALVGAQKYAVQLDVVFPRALQLPNATLVDNDNPGKTSHCSGTIVGSDAVLTAGHCYTAYMPVAVNPLTGAPTRERVRMYSITARARRNGNNQPSQPIAVGETRADWANWPGSDGNYYAADHDYAVLKLKRDIVPAPTPAARVALATPTGQVVEMAHYPFQEELGFRLHFSRGDVGGLASFPTGGPYSNTYESNASFEPNSSGAGIFQQGSEQVSGVAILEDRSTPQLQSLLRDRTSGVRVGPPGAMLNRVVMFTGAHVTRINDWASTPL